jgi:hypothetical protein
VQEIQKNPAPPALQKTVLPKSTRNVDASSASTSPSQSKFPLHGSCAMILDVDNKNNPATTINVPVKIFLIMPSFCN